MASLKKGDYQAPQSTDLRSPCPLVNSFANHGLIPRDGRDVHANELAAALNSVGCSWTVVQFFCVGGYLEADKKVEPGFFSFLRRPISYMLQPFGMRNLNQKNAMGVPCMNLDQLARHGIIEHDVSLSRHDAAQGDNLHPKKELIEKLLQASTDGKILTQADWAKLRQERLAEQKKDNPKLEFGKRENFLASTEVALLQTVFGSKLNGEWVVPVSFMKALFEEGRLPFNEGWKKREWWYLGIYELFSQSGVMEKLIGPFT